MRTAIRINLCKTTKQGKCYWIAHWTDLDGNRHQKSLGNAKKVGKREATRAVAMLERELNDDHDPQPELTLSEIVADAHQARADSGAADAPHWRTVSSRVTAHFGDRKYGSITRADATAHAERLRDEYGLGKQSVRNEVRKIRTAINGLIKQDRLAVNIFDHIPCGSLRKDQGWTPVARDDCLKIIDHPEVRVEAKRAILLARFAGFRSNEVRRAVATDFDLDAATVEVQNPNDDGEITNKKRFRMVPLCPEIMERANLLAGDRRGRLVPLAVSTLSAGIARAATTAGMEPWPEPLQVLRRSCLSDWCKVLTPAEAASIAGNTADVLMKHYYRIQPEIFDKISGRR